MTMSSSRKEFAEQAYQAWDWDNFQQVSFIPDRQQINFDAPLSVCTFGTDDPNSSSRFQIQSPSWNGATDVPSIALSPVYDVGPMSIGTNGFVVPSVVEAEENRDAAGQPVVKFYVQTGLYAPGTIHDIAPSSANPVQTDFTLSYIVDSPDAAPNGVWTIGVQRR
ncbi:hypothetical protein HGP17_32415 [Rhizobium sp. P38BS-XIX]|uniref:hypothetical protein n=1 Tax=Rhizobium sp. P38BS-XIX TaxID=2726740 RepID=UPI0014577BC5|nr:hypothetical protein [Rhizobium sp. P38BS-XIX]NLS01563.1 hypothetical protein [Rhizobium sp. P38BS-XIX]